MHRALAVSLACFGWVVLAGALPGLLPAAPSAGPALWGTRPYEQERLDYNRTVAGLEQRARALQQRKDAAQKKLDEFLAQYWQGQREEMLRAYRGDGTGQYASAQGRVDSALEKETALRNEYEDQRRLAQDERQDFVRRSFWPKHIAYLEARAERLQAEALALELQLSGMRDRGSTTWSELKAKLRENLVWIIKEVLKKLAGDLYSCFEEKFTGAMQAAVRQVPAGPLGPSVATASSAYEATPLGSILDLTGECVAEAGMKTLVNGLVLAWKREFMDDMQATYGVLPDVAAYWFDEIIAAELPEESNLLKRVANGVLSREALVSALQDEAAIQALANEEMEFLEAQYQDVARRVANPAAVKQTMEQIAETRATERFQGKGQFLKTHSQLSGTLASLKLLADITERLMEMSANTDTFMDIEVNEVARYRTIVACLKQRGEPFNDAETIIAKLKLGAREYAQLDGSCHIEAAAQPKPRPPAPPTDELRRMDEILERLHAILAGARQAVQEARAKCDAARLGLDGLTSRLAGMEELVAQLEEQLGSPIPAPSPNALADAQRLADEAYRVAGEVVEIKQRIEAAQSRACDAADGVAAATDQAERDRQLSVAVAAASEAGSLAASTAGRVQRAAAAAAEVESLVERLRPPAQPQDARARLASARAELQAARQALDAVDAAGQAAASAGGLLTRSRPEATALFEEARVFVSAHGESADLAKKFQEAQGVLAQLRALPTLTDCSVALPRQALDAKSRVENLKSRLDRLEPRLASVGVAPDLYPQIVAAAANARASAGVAEAFAEQCQAIAQQAEACRQRANQPGTSAVAAVAAGGAGSTQVVVPMLIGSTERFAVTSLQESGLHPMLLRGDLTSDPARVGRVDRQSPAPNARVAPQTVVSLWIAEAQPAAAKASPAPESVTPAAGVVTPKPENVTRATEVTQEQCAASRPGTVVTRDAMTGKLGCACPEGSAWSKVQSRCLSLGVAVAGGAVGGQATQDCSHMPGTLWDPVGRACRCPVGTWDDGQRRCVDTAAAEREKAIANQQKSASCEELYSRINMSRRGSGVLSGPLAAEAERQARAQGCDTGRIDQAIASGDEARARMPRPGSGYGGLTATPSGGDAGPKKSDPCAGQTQSRGALVPPVCTCPGYTWNGYQCVPSGGQAARGGDQRVDPAPSGEARVPSGTMTGDCAGRISVSVTSGYVGDPVVYTVVIDPPGDQYIVRVTTIDPLCPTCATQMVGRGHFTRTGYFQGRAGSFREKFLAFDAQGTQRCSGSTGTLTVLGPRR